MNKTASFTIIVSVFLICFQTEVIVDKFFAQKQSEQKVVVVGGYQLPLVTSTQGIEVDPPEGVRSFPSSGGNGGYVRPGGSAGGLNVSGMSQTIMIPELSNNTSTIKDFCDRFSIKV